MALQEDLNDNPPNLCIVDLEDKDIVVEYNELMEVDLKEADFGEDEDESEDEEHYQYYEENKDNNEDL